MISADEYLKSLDEKSVWVFTKQQTSNLEQIINATNMFDKIPDRAHADIEQYWKDHHTEFDVETDRHRTLVIPQFFGFVTKTPFYKRGQLYNKEKTTAVWDKLKSINPILSPEKFHEVLTEQILKIKIHAIIDTADNNEDYHILPVIFIYKVLKELQLQHDIKEVSIDHLYTYIMTCKEYSQWESAVEYIRTNSPISEHVEHYKDYSRIMALIKNNTNLFNITTDTISINPTFDNYFYNNFMLKYDIEELNEILYRDVDYSYFLYNVQDFDINLIDEPEIIEVETTIENIKEEVIESEESDEEKDDNYIEKIDKIDENNVNSDVAEGAYKIAPVILDDDKKISKKYKRNPLLGKIAIQKAYYCCEHNPNHETFISAKSHKNFMEAHHLVPVKYQQLIWAKYSINVDCVENIVSLCPTCHRAFHNGTKEVKVKIIEDIYQKLIPRYKSIGFNITIEEVKELYKVK